MKPKEKEIKKMNKEVLVWGRIMLIMSIVFLFGIIVTGVINESYNVEDSATYCLRNDYGNCKGKTISRFHLVGESLNFYCCKDGEYQLIKKIEPIINELVYSESNSEEDVKKAIDKCKTGNCHVVIEEGYIIKSGSQD